MRFSLSYKTLHLTVPLWKRILDEEMRYHISEGVSLWINTAMSIIPHWSGASHATFLRLSAKAQASLTSVAPGSSFAVKMAGGPTAGTDHSSARLTIYDGAYVVEYQTNLWHLVYNESNNANANPTEGKLFSAGGLRNPGPYRFVEQANSVFEGYAHTVQLPSPWLALKTKERKVR